MDKKLTKAQAVALDTIASLLIGRSAGVDRRTLRENGVRWDVVDRLCIAKLAYCTGQGFGRDRTRVELTATGYVAAVQVAEGRL